MTEKTPNTYDTLRRLIGWTAPPGSLVLSLYLDISPGAHVDAFDYARTSCDELVAEHEGKAGADLFARLVSELLERLPAQIEEARGADYDGLATFVCAAPPLRDQVRLRFAFDNQALVGRDPFLRHLLVFAEEYERALAVVLEAERAFVCSIHIGDIASVREVSPTERRDLPGELGALLARLVRDEPQHLLLFGAPLYRDPVEVALSQDVRGRIIDRIDEAPLPETPEFLRAVHRCLQAYERRAESAGVSRLLETTKSAASSPAVTVGLAETLAAINRGKIKVLYTLQSFSQPGWLCDVCDYLGALPAPPACVACGASVSPVQLEEHLFDQAAACGAEIETVFSSSEASDALAEVEGIGCLVDE